MMDPTAPDVTPDLAALVGSRLCHDLVSPLGAIGNGVELLQMVAPASPELALIAEAVAGAQARVRLFRLAFGAAAPGHEVRGADLTQALAALEGRIAVQTALPAALPRSTARRLALAALCAESALAWGGAVAVRDDQVTGTAPRLRLEQPLWDALAGGQMPRDLAPNRVHFALLATSGAVTVTHDETRVSISLGSCRRP
ncbi:MAG: hypothetical protein H6900_12385 [Rhodobacter sp.]|uniref:histidine phosphotransferase family protein n=1 Tax=Pararhodobacter sp. TaxID=2127056 RepID=UPI001D945210|nr:histidine phosphotransferase family protein [Pararhodobacter sp.]MCB1344168.1 hypothetical protein [Paracoccaceae bacterium]MCC0074077.1 hypothetical protein [Rhodobacter sp.]HPD93356.1 histidine phosphotransferase family protein [Pararhodobacter sp.]